MAMEFLYLIAAAIAVFVAVIILRPLFKNWNNSDDQSSSLTTVQVQAREEDFLPYYVPARVNTGDLPPPYYQ
jgi:hypothetical protein